MSAVVTVAKTFQMVAAGVDRPNSGYPIRSLSEVNAACGACASCSRDSRTSIQSKLRGKLYSKG